MTQEKLKLGFDKMKKNNIFLILLCCISIAYANNIETWNIIQASKKNGDFDFGVSEESRIGVDQAQTTKKLDEFHTTLFANYSFFNHFSLGIQDDFVLLRNGSDARYKRDNRPGVNASIFTTVYGFMFLNRSRFVMRDLEDERPYFRYRNLSKAMTPAICDWSIFRDIKLFAAYEWYFDEGSKDRNIRKNDKFDQFWLDFGVHVNVYKNFSFDIFYRLVEVKSTSTHDWNPGHAICTCLNFAF